MAATKKKSTAKKKPAVKKKASTRRKAVRRVVRKAPARRSTAKKASPAHLSKGTKTSLGNSSVKRASDLEFVKRAGAEIYEKLIDDLKKLKPGNALILDVPVGITIETFANRLQSAFSRMQIQKHAPKGKMFMRRKTKNGKIAITIEDRGNR